MRAGQYIKQPSGYRAFIPAPLPPDPPLVFDGELIKLLSEADNSLGRLDGITSVLPNPDLFAAMYVRQEAVLSSQIEGTQSTLEDVLQFEVDNKGDELPQDINEVVNYVKAMNYGLSRLQDFPLSLRLIREIHEKLLEGVRGSERTPGEFRTSQNWIGGQGSTISTAAFVPPPVHEMHQALDNLEKFLHDAASFPVLIRCGLAHAQFETIHPFLDGNGRIGRLLIAFLLCHCNILQRPLLYLSYYLKVHRVEYYDRLMAVRNAGDWEGWIKFFLRGVCEVSRESVMTARSILALREKHQAMIREKGASAVGQKLLDILFDQPIVSVRLVEQRLQCSYLTANKIVNQFINLGLLRETTGWQRNRRYAYEPYLALFHRSEKRDDDSASP